MEIVHRPVLHIPNAKVCLCVLWRIQERQCRLFNISHCFHNDSIRYIHPIKTSLAGLMFRSFWSKAVFLTKTSYIFQALKSICWDEKEFDWVWKLKENLVYIFPSGFQASFLAVRTFYWVTTNILAFTDSNISARLTCLHRIFCVLILSFYSTRICNPSQK